MARFSTLPTLAKPGPTNIGPAQPTTTHQGGTGWNPGDPHVELFNAAVSGMLADQFYETGDQRIERIVQLVKACNPGWLAQFVPWLRTGAGMRSASVVIAAEYAHAGHPWSRQVVDSALQRADEPGEILAYWSKRYGRPIPSRVKRGVADAVRRLYNERSLLAYDGGGRGWRFGDVLELVHPIPIAEWQSTLFRYALDRRRHPTETTVRAALPTVHAVLSLMDVPEDERRACLTALPDGFTWERLAGWLPGGMDAAAWETMIPRMGYMALVRNLNNFDRAGISPAMADAVRARLVDAEQITKSHIMPFRFLTAYKAAETDNYRLALTTAADLALRNLPRLPGRSLIMVDCSGSMNDYVGAGKSRLPLTASNLAGFMAEALARTCDEAEIVCYDTSIITTHQPMRHVGVVRAGADDRYRARGGTTTWQCTELAAAAGGYDRIVIITDEQTSDRESGALGNIPVITWNLAGYQPHHAAHDGRRRAFIAGYSDSAIQVLPAVIQRADGAWPWS